MQTDGYSISDIHCIAAEVKCFACKHVNVHDSSQCWDTAAARYRNVESVRDDIGQSVPSELDRLCFESRQKRHGGASRPQDRRGDPYRLSGAAPHRKSETAIARRPIGNSPRGRSRGSCPARREKNSGLRPAKRLSRQPPVQSSRRTIACYVAVRSAASDSARLCQSIGWSAAALLTQQPAVQATCQ
jgi:hypothetical protein